MHGICINPRARRLVMKAYFSIVDVDAAWVFVLVVCVCVCAAATVDDFHVRMTAQYNANERLRPRTCSRTKKLWGMCLTRLLRLLQRRRRVAYLDSEKLRSPAHIKTQSLAFVVVAAILVPIWCHHTSSASPQACNLQSQSQSDGAAASVSLDLFQSLLCLQLRLNFAQR